MFSIRDVVVFFVFPVLNFIIWFKLGQKSIILELSGKCPPSIDNGRVSDLSPQRKMVQEFIPHKNKKSQKHFLKFTPPEILDIDSKAFSAYSEEALVEMFFPGNSRTLLVNHHRGEACTGYINPMVAHKQECLAVAVTDSTSSSLDLRYNALAKKGPVVIDSKLHIFLL